MIHFKLLVPSYERQENLSISLLKDIENKLGIETKVEKFTDEEGSRIKLSELMSVSVFKRIGIKQTRRTKSLYTQLLVFLDGRLFTFYPQSYAEKEITIDDFLLALSKGNVACLHDKRELEGEILKLGK